MRYQLLWQVSQDGSNWEDMPTPSTYESNFEDLDDESYRSVLTGNLIRERISNDWIKIEMSWKGFATPDISEIRRMRAAVKTNPTFYVRCRVPEIESSDGSWLTFVAYCSKFKTNLFEAQVAKSVSFNIIQAEQGWWMS